MTCSDELHTFRARLSVFKYEKVNFDLKIASAFTQTSSNFIFFSKFLSFSSNVFKNFSRLRRELRNSIPKRFSASKGFPSIQVLLIKIFFGASRRLVYLFIMLKLNFSSFYLVIDDFSQLFCNFKCCLFV